MGKSRERSEEEEEEEDEGKICGGGGNGHLANAEQGVADGTVPQLELGRDEPPEHAQRLHLARRNMVYRPRCAMSQRKREKPPPGKARARLAWSTST